MGISFIDCREMILLRDLNGNIVFRISNGAVRDLYGDIVFRIYDDAIRDIHGNIVYRL